MEVASLENCKKLYELSGWEDTSFYHDSSYLSSLSDKHSSKEEGENMTTQVYDLRQLIGKRITGVQYQDGSSEAYIAAEDGSVVGIVVEPVEPEEEE